MKKKKYPKNLKKETVEEFLARGGEIQRVPYEAPDDINHVRSTVQKVAEPMSLLEGALLFSEKIRRKKKKKEPLAGIDISALPEGLLEKLKLDSK